MSQKLLAMIGVSAALLAAPLAASAADLMPLKAPMPAPVMSWTGCYVDGGWGYGMWNQDHYFTDAAGSSVTTTDGGRGWTSWARSTTKRGRSHRFAMADSSSSTMPRRSPTGAGR